MSNTADIQKLAESGRIVVGVFESVRPYIKPGITPLEINAIAEDYILSQNAKPAFKGYGEVAGQRPGFPAALCISVNDVVVHGIPNDTPLQDGDIISVDCGTYKDGYYGDSAYTFAVGTISEETKKLLKTTRESLNLAVEQAVTNNKVYDIARAVQTHCEKNGFSVVRDLVGHGVGKSLHEEPSIPNFVPPLMYRTAYPNVRLQEGLCIAIEPMINQGTRDVKTDKDKWTIRTRDGKLSAHFEKMVVIQKGTPLVLTDYNPSEHWF
jgi:methionyl aminopeptidase